jgi:hypothetical protein
MRRTIAPPPDLPRPTPNPEQIADPCREVVDPWGASAKLTDDEKAQLAGWVWQGPDLQNDGVAGISRSPGTSVILTTFHSHDTKLSCARTHLYFEDVGGCCE